MEPLTHGASQKSERAISFCDRAHQTVDEIDGFEFFRCAALPLSNSCELREAHCAVEDGSFDKLGKKQIFHRQRAKHIDPSSDYFINN